MDMLELLHNLDKVWFDSNNEQNEDTDRDYEKQITTLIFQNFGSKEEKNLLKLLGDYDKDSNFRDTDYSYFFYSQSDEYCQKIAYTAFFSLITYYRHQFDNEKLNILWKDYRKKFTSFKSYKHLEILYILYNIKKIKTIQQANHYLRIAKDNIEKYKDSKTGKENPGFNHALGDLYACICEKFENDSIIKIKKKWEDIAINAVSNAIKIETYAVFYCTYGRILSISGKFEKAEKQFNLAISKENSSIQDYSLRLGKYNYYRNYNKSRILAKRIQDQFDTIDSMKNSIITNIEVVGIFSGIVSLIISSLQIANNHSPVESGLLILTLMGVLVAALSTFSLLLHIGRIKLSHLITTIVIILLSVVFSITMVFKLSRLESNNNDSDNSQSITSEELKDD